MALVPVSIHGTVDYDTSLKMQHDERQRVSLGKSRGTIFLLEHDPPVITMGRHASDRNILISSQEAALKGYTIKRTDRGGDITVHEPGQLILYFVLPVHSKQSGPFVKAICQHIAGLLNQAYPVSCAFNEKVPGLFTSGKKLGSVGFDLRGGVSMHGIAINICNSLSGFELIVPCGHHGTVMTSLSRELGRSVPVAEVIGLLKDDFVSKGLPV